MKVDKSWKALRRPGEADDFFQGASSPPAACSSEFSCQSAWLLSEISRLIYKQDTAETGIQNQTSNRNSFLARLKLREKVFLNESGTQAAVIESEQDGAFSVLVFRGTQTLNNWIRNLDALPIDNPEGGLIHKGFKTALDVVWPKLEEFLERLNSPVYFTGHSLGGALALAAAARSKVKPISVYTFGSPRVGDVEFNALLDDTCIYRIVNNSDIVPTLPPPGRVYKHAGDLYLIDSGGTIKFNPDRSTRISQRIDSILDFKDLLGQFETLAPHRMLYEHASVNYSTALAQNLKP